MHSALDRLPSLNALRAFEAAARNLSFRVAADELQVTQSAVAQHVRGLEVALETKLFHRHARALSLTDSGQRYATSVQRAFELLAEATQGVRPQPLALTISVTPTFAAKWLLPRLADFTRSSRSSIELQILATERICHFQGDAVDLAVRYGRPPFGAGLHAEMLFENALIAVASPNLVERLGEPDCAQRLARYTLLHDAHNAWPAFLHQALPQGPVTTQKNIRFNQAALAIDAAVAGQGIALAHPAFVAMDIATNRLVRVLQTQLVTDSGFYLVHPRKTRHPGPVAVVRDWLCGQARSHTGIERPRQVLGGATESGGVTPTREPGIG